LQRETMVELEYRIRANKLLDQERRGADFA
jgi:hypothetical protein